MADVNLIPGKDEARRAGFFQEGRFKIWQDQESRAQQRRLYQQGWVPHTIRQPNFVLLKRTASHRAVRQSFGEDGPDRGCAHVLMLNYRYLLLACCFFPVVVHAQVTGGQAQMVFLTLPNSPRISALGGMSVASPVEEVAFGFQNPALLRPALNRQIGLAYNAFYAGSSLANAQYAHHATKLNTTFGAQVQYLNYGNFQQTDAAGNILGDARATEYAVTIGAGRQYGERWRYGAALKLAQSSLAGRSSTASLLDVGIAYEDTARGWNIGLVARNMGFVLKKYNSANSAEPLPFDLQLGVSKSLRHLPLRIFATAHHLYQWDVRYDNPADRTSNAALGGTDTTSDNKSHFADKLFRHLSFGAELTLGKRLTLSGSYNHLRRAELALTDKKGAAGLAFGLGVNLNKLRVQYARSYYATGSAYNEFGLTVLLDQFVRKR